MESFCTFRESILFTQIIINRNWILRHETKRIKYLSTVYKTVFVPSKLLWFIKCIFMQFMLSNLRNFKAWMHAKYVCIFDIILRNSFVIYFFKKTYYFSAYSEWNRNYDHYTAKISFNFHNNQLDFFLCKLLHTYSISNHKNVSVHMRRKIYLLQ